METKDRRKSRGYARFIVGLTLAFIIMPWSLVFSHAESQTEASHKSVTANADIQEEIKRVVSLLSSGPMSEQKVSAIIDDFKSFKKQKVGDLLLQVLLAYGGKLEHRENPKAEMAKRALLSHLAQEIPGQELISIIAPHFEETTDPGLKGNLKQMLVLVALKEANTSFAQFDAYLESKKDAPPSSLIRFMYHVDPKRAAIATARVYAGKKAADELSDKLKKEDTEALELFSKSTKWWKQLYVVAKMQMFPPQLSSVQKTKD